MLPLPESPTELLGISAFDRPALNLTLGHLLTADTVLNLCQGAAGQVRDLTDFDRVAVYYFAEAGSGHVVAEALRPGFAPGLGLHYPATEIPQQARALYLENWLRFIADAAYVPVPLVPALAPGTGHPPDMTYAALRSVLPTYLEYLRNMGSAATMTISLMQDGQLWGRITCHHAQPRLVSYKLRDLYQFLSKTVSALLKIKQQQDGQTCQQRIHQAQAQLLGQVQNPATMVAGLRGPAATVQNVFDCGGAAICLGGEVICLGSMPSNDQSSDLVAWLRTRPPQPVFHTNSYAQLNPAGIGTAARHHHSIFRLFKQRHAPKKYGGGTEAGHRQKNGGEARRRALGRVGGRPRGHIFSSISKYV